MISDEKLLALYSAACAPLSPETLINELQDLEPRELNAQIAIDELKYLKQLSSAGFDVFASAFEDVDVDAGEQSAEFCVALVAASTFAKRLSTLAHNLSVLCLSAAEKVVVDPAATVKDLETRVKSGARPEVLSPAGSLLKETLDYTPNTRWGSLEVSLKNRVGFKTTTAVISDGKVEEEALKVTEFKRKKQRNPTGYHKFTFKDLGIDDSDFESESRRSRASSARGAPSTDGESTRGSLGGLGHAGALTSRSASSGAEEDAEADRLDPHNPFATGARAGSSVVFSFDREREVIEDQVADPQWDAQQRHQKRYSRIRNRVPTGHPSMMHGASDEMAGLVHDYERQISALQTDNITAENTETNKVVPGVPGHDPQPSGRKGTVTIVEDE